MPKFGLGWSASCRGVTLRGCEDINDAAVILLSKYIAAQEALPDALTALDIAGEHSSSELTPEPATAHVTPIVPSFRNVSLQRSVLSSSLVGLRKAEAPSNLHAQLQPVLHADAAAASHQGPARNPTQHHRSQRAAQGECCQPVTGMSVLCHCV